MSGSGMFSLTRQRSLGFVAVAAGGLALTELFTLALVDTMKRLGTFQQNVGSTETFAYAAAVGMVSIYSFLLHKHFTFKLGFRAGSSRL